MTDDRRDPPAGVGASVGSVFANARATVAKAPWADARIEAPRVLVCQACGAPQAAPLEFTCCFCGGPMVSRALPAAGGGDEVSQEILGRFQAFVHRVSTRLTEVLTESDAGFAALLADPALDPIAFVNASHAIELRVKELHQKIEETYTKELAPVSSGTRREADRIRHQTQGYMQELWERFRTGWNLKLVQALYPRVARAMAAEVPCGRCGAVLEARTTRHLAESVRCAHCGAVNSITPEPIVYTYFSLAPDLVADAQTIVQKLAIERACEGGAPRPERMRLWESYWTAYVGARAGIMPMDEDERRRFVTGKLEWIRRYG